MSDSINNCAHTLGFLLLLWLVLVGTSSAETDVFTLSSRTTEAEIVRSPGTRLDSATITLTDNRSEFGTAFVKRPLNLRHFTLRLQVSIKSEGVLGGKLPLCLRSQKAWQADELAGGVAFDCGSDNKSMSLTLVTGPTTPRVGHPECPSLNCVSLRMGKKEINNSFDMSRSGIDLKSNHALEIYLFYSDSSLQISITDLDRHLSVNKTYYMDLPRELGSVAANVGLSASTTLLLEAHFVSSTQLEAALLPEDVAVPGQHKIEVVNPPLGGGISNGISFSVK